MNTQQNQQKANPWLLVSDVDDTLTGDDAALLRFAEAVATRHPGLLVALNSGKARNTCKNLPLQDALPNEGHIPQPKRLGLLVHVEHVLSESPDMFGLIWAQP